MDPATLAAGINAGANLIGTALSGNLNRKNRRFNAEQAQLNRDFQAQQAELARDWQERFYQQYQTPAALVRQGKEAGLHPYAALGMSPSGASSTSVPQGSHASSGQVLDPQHSMSNIANTMLNLLEMKSRIDLNESQAKKNNAEATGVGIENQFKPQLLEQQLRRGEVDIDNLQAGISRIDIMNELDRDNLLTNAVDRELKRSNINEVLARTDKVILEQATERLKQANIKQSTKNLAEECLKIQLERDILVVQKVCEQNKGALLSEQVFEAKFQNAYRGEFNSNPPTGNVGGVIQTIFGGMHRKNGIRLTNLINDGIY